MAPRSKKGRGSGGSKGRGPPSKRRRAASTVRTRTVHWPSLPADVTVLRKGSVLYTGDTALPATCLFATPSRAYAATYATAPGARVFRLRLRRDVVLVPKRMALWAVRASNPPEEWERFGSDAPDYAAARALCRRAGQEGHRAHGIDGWVHALRSPTLGEVMLCAGREGVAEA